MKSQRLAAKSRSFGTSPLMGLFHWNRPCNRLYDSSIGCKNRGIGDENHKKARVNAVSVTSPLQDVAHPNFLHKLRVYLVLVEFNIFICIMIGGQKRSQLNPGLTTCPTASITAIAPASPRRSRQIPGSYPGSFKDKKKDATAISWSTSYTPTSQNTRILPPAFMTPSKNAYTTASRGQSPIVGSHYRWTETGNNDETPGNRRDLHLLAVSLAGSPSANSSPRSVKPYLLNSRTNICVALIALMNGKGWRKSSELDEMSPML